MAGSLNYSYFRTEIKGNNQNTVLSNSNYSWTAKFNTMITLPKKIGIQISGNTEISRLHHRIYETNYFRRCAVKKDILKDKATISFRLSDVFNTMRYVQYN